MNLLRKRITCEISLRDHLRRSSLSADMQVEILFPLSMVLSFSYSRILAAHPLWISCDFSFLVARRDGVCIFISIFLPFAVIKIRPRRARICLVHHLVTSWCVRLAKYFPKATALSLSVSLGVYAEKREFKTPHYPLPCSRLVAISETVVVYINILSE